MGKEIDLIRIHTTTEYDSLIDFGVFPSVDNLSEQEREQLLETLEKLARRLKNNEYPFSR